MNKCNYYINWAINARSENDFIYDYYGNRITLPFKESIWWAEKTSINYTFLDLPVWVIAGGHNNMTKKERKEIEHNYREYQYRLDNPTQEEQAEKWAQQQYYKNR